MSFQQSPIKISPKHFIASSRITAFTIFFRISKLHERNGQSLVMFSVQRV